LISFNIVTMLII